MTSRWRVAALILSAACGKTQPDADTAVTAATTPVATITDTVKAPPASPCAHTGEWAECSIERRLKQSGFVVRRVDEPPAKRAGFSIDPIVYSLGSSRLEVFLYSNETAAAKDLSGIDSATAVPSGSPSPWETPPVLIKSGNLVAVLLSQNPRQIERAVLAITAGAPQPGSPR